MSTKHLFSTLFFFFGYFCLLQAQNPNLVTTDFGVTYDASSANPNLGAIYEPVAGRTSLRKPAAITLPARGRR